MNLINGDCLEELTKIENGIIDLCILDLPYGQTDAVWDKTINLEQLWVQLKRVSKDTTPFIFFTTTKFGYELIKSNEKWFRYDLVWHKPNSSAGFLLSGKMPLRQHEMIYIFYNKLPYYGLKENHTCEEIPKKNGKTSNGSIYTTKCSSNVRRIWSPPIPNSVLNYDITNKRKNRLHPTEKPIELLKWIIKYYSKENDMVLDCCMGVGSTGVACKELNRQFIGIELNKEYFDIATQRCTDVTQV